MSEGAKKYDMSKKEEAFLYEMEVRQEKERIIREHEERRERYLQYLKERKEEQRLRWWQKAFLYFMGASFLFCLTMLVCSLHPTGKAWVHDLLSVVLHLV